MRVSLERQSIVNAFVALLLDTRFWLFFIVVGFVAHTFVFGRYLIDDAIISLSYSRSLANGHGFVLTPESERVEGYSNFLWVVLFALPFKLGLGDLHPMWLYKPVGIALGIGTLIFVYLLPRIAYNASRNDPLSLFAPLALSISTTFTHWMVAGLENPLYVFLLTLSVYFYLRELKDLSCKPWSVVALLLLALTRPEGIMYFGVVLIHRILYLAWNRHLPVRRDMIWIGAFIIGYGIFLLWRYSYFGYWVPNTFYAKVSEERNLIEVLFNFNDRGWQYLFDFASLQWLIFFFPFFVFGLLSRTGWWANVLFVGILLSTALYIIYAGGDWMQEFRFISVALPFLYLLVGRGLSVLQTALASDQTDFITSENNILTVGAMTLVGIVVVVLTLVPNYNRSTTIRMNVPADIIMARGERMRSYAQHLNLVDAQYLEPDVGGTSYVSGLTILDLAMLTDIHSARFRYFPPMYREYIFNEQKPELVRTHGFWTRTARLTAFPEFWDVYVPIEAWIDEYGISGEFVRKDLFIADESDLQDVLPSVDGTELSLRQFNPVTSVGYPGQVYQFTWYWQCDPTCTKDYQTRIVMRHQDTKTEVQYDFDPVFGWYPTSLWESGEVISETYHIALPTTMPDGAYDILVGVVDGATLLSLSTIDQVTISQVAARQRAAERFDESATLQAQGAWEAAHVAIVEATLLEPNNAEYAAARDRLLDDWQASLAALSASHMESGEWIRAVDSMQLLQQLGPLEGDAQAVRRSLRDRLFNLGQDAFAAHQYDTSFNYFQQALAIDPQYVWARHRLEDAREMRHYVEFYCATGKYEKLWNTYQQEVRAGNPPSEDEIAQLYLCLKTVADPDTLSQWRAALEFPDNADIIFYEEGTPKVRLRGYKIEPYIAAFKLHLYFELIEPVDQPYVIWLHGAVDDVSILRSERRQYGFENFGNSLLTPPITEWVPGEIYQQTYLIPAYPGEYDLRFGFWVPSSEDRLSLDVANTTAGARLEKVQVGSPKYTIEDRHQ